MLWPHAAISTAGGRFRLEANHFTICTWICMCVCVFVCVACVRVCGMCVCAWCVCVCICMQVVRNHLTVMDRRKKKVCMPCLWSWCVWKSGESIGMATIATHWESTHSYHWMTSTHLILISLLLSLYSCLSLSAHHFSLTFPSSQICQAIIDAIKTAVKMVTVIHSM